MTFSTAILKKCSFLPLKLMLTSSGKTWDYQNTFFSYENTYKINSKRRKRT